MRALSIFHCPDDSFTDNFRSQKTGDILISRNSTDRDCVNTVSICRGMDRMNGAGKAVLGKSGDLAELGLVKVSVRDYHAERCVPDEFVLDDLYRLRHVVCSAAKSCFVRCEHPGNLGACFPVEDVPQRIQDNNSANFSSPICMA